MSAKEFLGCGLLWVIEARLVAAFAVAVCTLFSLPRKTSCHPEERLSRRRISSTPYRQHQPDLSSRPEASALNPLEQRDPGNRGSNFYFVSSITIVELRIFGRSLSLSSHPIALRAIMTASLLSPTKKLHLRRVADCPVRRYSCHTVALTLTHFLSQELVLCAPKQPPCSPLFFSSQF